MVGNLLLNAAPSQAPPCAALLRGSRARAAVCTSWNASGAHDAASTARSALTGLRAARRPAVLPWSGASPAARRGTTLAAAGGAPSSDDDDPTYEPMRKARVKGKLQAKVKVSTPTVDAALDGAPPTELAQAETTAVLGLTAVFAAIMIEGLLVAASGFMSEEWDGIVQAKVLPIFGPTLGFFLLCSSAYGVWKAYGKQN